MVNKITTPPTTSELIGTVNEIIDDKQDTLVSGTNIKTINNTSILGSGNIDIQGGSSYTAGTGIDITNDVISVANTVVTTNTAQDITARKTFFGEKAIYFKQNTASNKLGFTLYNNNNKEVGALEFRPNSIKGTPILTLNSPSPLASGTSRGNSYVGFRYWDNSLNILAPFSTSFGYNKNLFIPVTFTNGTTTVESTSTDGSVDISSLLPTKTSDLTNDSGYITVSSLPTVNNATLTITQGGVSKGTFTANASSDVTIALDSGVSVIETYSSGTNWYRIYSDGWCEQGGQTSQFYETVTLLKEMADTNYSVSVTCKRGTAPTVQEGNTCGYASSTTQAFICSGATGVGSFWEVRGYISQGV